MQEKFALLRTLEVKGNTVEFQNDNPAATIEKDEQGRLYRKIENELSIGLFYLTRSFSIETATILLRYFQSNFKIRLKYTKVYITQLHL